MKFGQLIEYNKRKIFLQKLCRRWDREASSRLFILKKCLIWGKSKWSAAYFQYISIALSLGYNKSKLYKMLDYWSRDMLNFNFPEKGSWASFSTTFCVWFFKKNISCYILLTDQFSMPDYFYFSRYCEVCVLQWVLLNRPPSSTQLLPPPPSSIYLHPAPSTSTQLIPASNQLHPSPPSSLQHSQQYLNQNIAHNWAISPNLCQKSKTCPFWLKIGTHGILEMLIPNPDLDFWNSDPKIHFWANLGPKI